MAKKVATATPAADQNADQSPVTEMESKAMDANTDTTVLSVPSSWDELSNASYDVLTAALADAQTATLDINGLPVTVPNKFVLLVDPDGNFNGNTSDIMFAHVSGQFRNNQVANSKARAERYAKNGKPEDAPWSVEQYQEAWLGNPAKNIAPYMPKVGVAGDRLSEGERNRLEAAKRVLIKLINEHNSNLANGKEKILNSPKHVDLPKRPKKDGKSAADHKSAIEAWEASQETLYKQLLATPKYAARIQAELDSIEAEKGKSDTVTVEAENITASLL